MKTTIMLEHKSVFDWGKKTAVMNYWRTRSKEEILSMMMLLFYPEDIEQEYDGLPDEFKKVYPRTASTEKKDFEKQ